MNSVLVFSGLDDGDAMICIDNEESFHTALDAESLLIATEVDYESKIKIPPSDVLEACIIKEDVIQYCIKEHIWRGLVEPTRYMSSRIIGLYKEGNYYIRRSIAKEYPDLFKDIHKKRRLIRYE